jgi:hypothetical protein
VPLTVRPRLSATPPPVTVPAHLSALSPALSPTARACARGARRPPAPRAGCCRRRPPVGTGPHEPPRAAWHSHARDPLFPSLFPSRPRCRRAHSAARPLRSETVLFHPSPTSLSSARASPPLPAPDRRLRSPELASPSRISADLRRRPPLPGELFPEPPIPGISCNFLTPAPLPSCRTSSATPATTGGPSPPTNAAARRRWHRLTVDPPFRCALVPSSLPGAFPVTPSRPPAAPCRRRATAEPSASAPPRRPVRGDSADAPAVRAQRARRPVPPLGWAARPWPSRRSADRAWQAATPRGL